jgi:hypothetical protein
MNVPVNRSFSPFLESGPPETDYERLLLAGKAREHSISCNIVLAQNPDYDRPWTPGSRGEVYITPQHGS